MTRGDLRAILEAGDVEACLAYFEHATEDERRSVAELAIRWYALQNATPLITDGPGRWRGQTVQHFVRSPNEIL